MRVLQVVDSLDPVYGGPPTVALRVAAALAREGAEVTLYSSERPGRETAIVSTLRGIPGMELVRRVSDVSSNRAQSLLGLAASDFLRRRAGPHDVIHVHGVWRPGLRAVLSQAARASIPAVVTPHGMLTRWSLAQKPWRKRIGLALTWRRLLSGAAFLQALTRSEADDLRALRIDVPVEVIPNGLFVEEVGELPPPGSFHSALPELGGHPFILSLGRLHHIKRPELLVRAFVHVAKAAPELHLVMAGPDCGSRRELEQLVGQLGLRSRVHLPGPLWGPTKYGALVDALCFCQTSLFEALSMSLLEAMACGTPLVITRGCNFEEVQAGGAGLVVDGEEHELAQAILRLCTDAALRDEAGRKARELAMAKYRWPVVARTLLDSYARACRRA